MTEEFYEKESQAQKWRRITPLAVISNLLTTFFGVSLSVYFGNYYIQTQDKKFDLDDQRIETIMQDNKNDRDKYWGQYAQFQKQLECTKIAVSSCCGDKGNIGNC